MNSSFLQQLQSNNFMCYILLVIRKKINYLKRESSSSPKIFNENQYVLRYTCRIRSENIQNKFIRIHRFSNFTGKREHFTIYTVYTVYVTDIL